MSECMLLICTGMNNNNQQVCSNSLLRYTFIDYIQIICSEIDIIMTTTYKAIYSSLGTSYLYAFMWLKKTHDLW